MGLRPAIIAAVPLLLATPSAAQDQQGGDPVFNLPRTGQPPADPNRQGPELDVFRGAPVTPPPVTPPIITPPPQVIAPPASTPEPQPSAPAQPQRPATPPAAPAQPAPRTESDAPAPAAPLPQTAPSSPAEPQAAPQPSAAEPSPPPPPSAPAQSSSWQWIAGAIALLAAALAAAWLFLRRRREEQPDQEPIAEEAQPESPAPVPPRRAPDAKPAPPAPAPKPASPPAMRPSPKAAASDRPWLDLSLEIRSARLSLMGATVGYSLTLHNRGALPAEDILVRTLIANADTGQQATMQQFFAGATGMPTHSAVSIAPGESHSLTGELRLLPDQIAPVQMGNRALLIPLVAFDAQYRWADEAGDSLTGTGRTGRAFIVGQEKSPPADRLAPFRLDQGPRQFRTPGSRATALELAS
ncbi:MULTISPECIES: hypothetical protein [Sphingobium]|uniref:hypothetical protein n=1 Tax=Sphingobium sp. MI1205 TaxID=407020 RepID=UPI0007828AC6|nr:hypothetical protein [Sphingobium sp. MI1205]